MDRSTEKVHEGRVSTELSDREVTLDPTARWARDRLEQLKTAQELAKRERQAGRSMGHLTQSLGEKLRACNIAQLQQAKKLCDRYILDQRKPPAISECRERYTVKVIDSVCVKNRRYQLELQRTTKTAKKVYVNGPYIRAYHRDGSIIKVDRFKRKDKELYKKLPRKVWSAFRAQLDSPELESLRRALVEKQNA